VGFLDAAGLSHLWKKIDTALAAKQDKLTGTPGQVVGFSAGGSASVVQGWSNPNLLDNWYFVDPINQRGQTEHTENGYTIDRWLIKDGFSLFLTSKDGIKLTYGSQGGVWPNLRQVVEPYRFLPGQPVTFSALIRKTNSAKFLAVIKNESKDLFSVVTSDTINDWTIVTATGEVPSDSKSVYVFFYLNNPSVGDSIDIKAAKLEIGSQQTLARQDASGNWVLNDPPPNKALELAKCQRYQYAVGGHSRY